MNHDLVTYILLFFTYSITGWCIEVIRIFFNPKFKKFINRGFLIGPYLPIYGSGVVAITLFVGKYSSNMFTIFLLTIIICGIIEYLTSLVMEKLFNARWWDYSEKKFNINGRVCLENLIPFGIGGTIILHWINPAIINIYNEIPMFPKSIIAYTLLGIISIDGIVSLTIMTKFKTSANSVDLSEPDDTENISQFIRDTAADAALQLESNVRKQTRKRRLKAQRKILHLRLKTSKKIAKAKLQSKEIQQKIVKTMQIKEKFASRNILTRRLINAFPNVKILSKKIKKEP